MARGTRALWFQWEQLVLIKGILYRQCKTRNRSVICQLIVPSSMQKEVLKQSHDGRTGGHLGQKCTLSKIQKNFYWVGYRRTVHVDVWVNGCQFCQA